MGNVLEFRMTRPNQSLRNIFLPKEKAPQTFSLLRDVPLPRITYHAGGIAEMAANYRHFIDSCETLDVSMDFLKIFGCIQNGQIAIEAASYRVWYNFLCKFQGQSDEFKMWLSGILQNDFSNYPEHLVMPLRIGGRFDQEREDTYAYGQEIFEKPFGKILRDGAMREFMHVNELQENCI